MGDAKNNNINNESINYDNINNDNDNNNDNEMNEVSLAIDAEREAALEAERNREVLEKNINNLWGYSAAGLESKKAAMTMLSTKTGMYARIPIVCKGDGCPYAESCQLLPHNLAPYAEYCPIETTQIEYRFQGYAQDFGIDNASFTDKCLISEIINCDIMMERCIALMAKEGTPVVDIVAGISEHGDEILQPEVSKYWEAYERAVKKRNEAYNLMMATRKDKKNDEKDNKSLSQILSEAVSENEFVIEHQPKENGYVEKTIEQEKDSK